MVADFEAERHASSPGLVRHLGEGLHHALALDRRGWLAGQPAQVVGDAAAEVRPAQRLELIQGVNQKLLGPRWLFRHIGISGQHQRCRRPDAGIPQHPLVAQRVERLRLQERDIDEVEAEARGLIDRAVPELGRPLSDPQKRVSPIARHATPCSSEN